MTFRLCPNTGPQRWSLTQDQDGFREYKIKFRVETDDPLDGPYLAMQTSGLPAFGSFWDFGNDVDPYAYCRLPVVVSPECEGEPNLWFDLEYTFSNKPDAKRCKDEAVTDPLLIPQEISGGFTRFQEEAVFDRFGKRIATSSHEPIRGPQNEWDASRPKVTIRQNVVSLEFPLLCQLIDTVNAFPLWGFPPRTVKLSGISFERKFYGACYAYYTRTFEFEMRYRQLNTALTGPETTGTGSVPPSGGKTTFETFDRVFDDEGANALQGEWNRTTGLWDLTPIGGTNPDPKNPTHFKRYKDRDGNPIRGRLDGAGKPFNPLTVTQVTGCSQCPKGSPSIWRVGGLSVELTLTYSTSCTWTGTTGTDSFTLDFVPQPAEEDDEWQLEASDGTVWVAPAATWNCLGPNVMFRDDFISGSADQPEAVTLTSGDQPGSIAVQKYGEADFMQLGIPSQLPA